MSKKLSNILLYLFASVFVFNACSSDNDDTSDSSSDNGDKTPYTVTYRISTQKSFDASASDEEMMKTILLVIVKPDGRIEDIEDIELPDTEEEHVIEMQLTTGRKYVYGFANLNDAMRNQTGLSALSVGSTMPDLSATTLTIENGYTIDSSADKYLPMSNTTDFFVNSVNGQSFGMELIRLVSKVKFAFKNESGEKITLKQLTMSPLTTSAVYLMPGNSGKPVFPTTHTQGDYIYNFDTGYVFNDGEELEYTTYINESEINGTGWFQVRLTTQTGDGTASEERIALTNLTYINRNDYLNLPIVLTDYKLEIDVRSYPPIGGYPASVVYNDDAYHITFSGGGPFIITPKLIQLSNNTEVTLTDSDWVFDYTDTTPSFFEELPAMKNGEIYGVINASAKGSVLFNLSAKVTTSAGIQRIVSYKIYINQN